MSALHHASQARRLGDTLYYWERMKRSGIQPDVSPPLPNRSEQCHKTPQSALSA